MLVDPNTGEVIESGRGNLAQDVTQTALDNAQLHQSRLYDMANYIPSAKQTAGWNAWRGSRSITEGLGRKGLLSTTRGEGLVANSLKATFHPRNLGTMPTYEALGTYAGSNAYSPFNFLAKTGNWASNKMISRSIMQSKESMSFTPLVQRMHKAGMLSADEFLDVANRGKKAPDMFSGGVVSRLSASAKVAPFWKDATAIARPGQAANVAKFLGATDSGLLSAAEAKFGQGLAGATRGELAHLPGMSTRGFASQAISGYMTGARVGYSGAIQEVGAAAGRTFYEKGASMAVKHLAEAGIEHAGGKLVASAGSRLATAGIERVGVSTLGKVAEVAGTKVALRAGGVMAARAIGWAIPGVNIAMAVWTAYDLTKMGIAGLKGGTELMKDAYKSFQGSLYKPTMGMGYRDTEVAATSRQRGVMAIQNSRLNARSVLGNEAAPMAAHFG